MNEIPHEPQNESNAKADSSSSEAAQPETPPGMLPLVEPFFGANAFFIAAVPFLIYFLGTAAGAHLENTRKLQPLHELKGVCRSKVENLEIKAEELVYTEELNEQFGMGFGPEPIIDSVKYAMSDETSDAEGLYKKCQQLVMSSSTAIEGLPEELQGDVVELRTYVQKYLDLEELQHIGQTSKIRPEYIEFMKQQDPNWNELQLNVSWYPTYYSITCLAATIALLFCLPIYLKKMPFRISGLAVALGVIGVVAWIGLWWVNDQFRLWLTENFQLWPPKSRAAFNPFEELKENPMWMWTFLGIRLFGMCLIIPIAEEFFLRGFLMRYCEDIDWDQIPIGEATWRGIACIFVYATFSHVETLAAIVWFGMVTWMYLKTKNIWDCVVTHAVTNALLAGFVLYTGLWELW